MRFAVQLSGYTIIELTVNGPRDEVRRLGEDSEGLSDGEDNPQQKSSSGTTNPVK